MGLGKREQDTKHRGLKKRLQASVKRGNIEWEGTNKGTIFIVYALILSVNDLHLNLFSLLEIEIHSPLLYVSYLSYLYTTLC